MAVEGAKASVQAFVLAGSVVIGSLAAFLLQRYAIGAIGGGAVAGAVFGLIAGRKFISLILGAIGGAIGGFLVHAEILTPLLRSISRTLNLGNM